MARLTGQVTVSSQTGELISGGLSLVFAIAALLFVFFGLVQVSIILFALSIGALFAMGLYWLEGHNQGEKHR